MLGQPIEDLFMNNDERRRLVTERFVELYDHQPALWVQAPGRVDLMGSHTDYNEGFVLTQAIDRNTWIAAWPRDDRRVTIASFNANGVSEFDLDGVEYDTVTPWTNYVRGVAHILQQENYQLTGFDGLIHSTVPFGSGLSSSAALEVATAVLFNELGGLGIDPVRMAKLCQRAENEFVGMNCGILDQYSSAMGEEGSMLLLDCRDITSVTRPIAEGIHIIICDTRAHRALTGSEYPERRAQCEEGASILARYYPDVKALRDVSLEQLEEHESDLREVVARRCRFVIQENQRVLDMAVALEKGDHALIRCLAADSYAGARDLYEISSREMEQMMAAMQSAPGLIAARQAGAGFGGCMVALVKPEHLQAFMAHVEEDYQSRTGIAPQVYEIQAAAGAGKLA
jgi:galactokinase